MQPASSPIAGIGSDTGELHPADAELDERQRALQRRRPGMAEQLSVQPGKLRVVVAAVPVAAVVAGAAAGTILALAEFSRNRRP